MANSWVIRLLQADNAKTPILVKVTRKQDGHDVDLDLLATDGDAAYKGKGRLGRKSSRLVCANSLKSVIES